jgi:Ca2+-binding EF-hand superfamily protein
MAVLMQLSQQGGMMSSGGGAGGQGGQFAANVYASMDTDSDGSVTQAEFISARPDDVSEDDAKALYASIDTEGTGSITEEQFADSMKSAQGGGAPSGGGQSAEEVYDALDTNQDGVVSQDEFLVGKPDDMSTEDATALFDALDTEDSGSITEEQFAASMQGPRGPGGPPPSGGGQSSEETYDALDTNEDGVVSQDEFLAAKPDDVSTEDATALFKSIDTENTGSISEEQFSDFMEASRPSMNASIGMSGGTTDISSLLALLDTTASETEDTASVLA